MVEYVDGAGLILHPDDIGNGLLKQPVFDQCPVPVDGPTQLGLNVLWKYDPLVASSYALGPPSTSQDVCVAPMQEMLPSCSQPPEYSEYHIEELPREEEFFEEITRARCIDCDKIVDMAQSAGVRKHTCELLKKHACQHCGSRFNFPANLAVHRILQHTPQATFTAGTECELCDNKAKRKFQRFNAYLAHVKTHVRSETYACSNCGEEFEYQNLFNRHRRISHGIGEGTLRRGYSSELGYCNKCDKLLELTKVDAHRLTHAVHSKIERKEKSREKVAAEVQKQDAAASTKKKYACEQCAKAFVRPAELKRHQAVHEKGAKFKCSSCDKPFSHEAGLNAHLKLAHSVQKPKFSCTICGIAFNKRSNVERHVKTVHPLSTKIEMFDCTKCTCQFKTSGALSKHLRLVHNEAKPSYECRPCGKAFSVLGSLRSHELIHAEVSDYPHHCFKCNKRFKLRSSLKLHLDVHQRKEIDDPLLTDPKCPICLKHLSSKNNLRRHLLTHQNFYECPDCCHKFSSIHRLDRHRCFKNIPTTSFSQDMDVNLENRQAIVPTKSYYCKQCPSSFYSFKAFKEHKSLHSGLKPHLCWTCHKAFRTADILAMHKEIHSREPMYCEYCPMVLNSRAQHSAHVRNVHQHNALEPMTTVMMQKQRDIEISSSQSFPNVDERGGMTNGFPTRAQSVALEGREGLVVESWHPMAPTETVPDRALRCPVCFHLFDSVAHLSQHFANTQDDRDHSFVVIQCPLCELSLRGSGEAAAHFSMVHVYMDGQDSNNRNGLPVFVQQEEVTYVENRPPSSKIQQCHLCPAKFLKPSDLERHMRTHTGERPFECDVCSRSFSLRSSLTSHMKTHNRGEPEQLCTVCGAQFYNKNALVLHMRIHSGEKPLRCRFCPLSFRTSAGRQQHERSAHNATVKNCSGRCRNRSCPNCSTGKRARIAIADRQMQPEFPPFGGDLTDSFDPNANLAVVDEGFVFPNDNTFPNSAHFEPPKSSPPPKDKGALIMDTLAQISRIDGLPLEPAKSSAFARAAPTPSSSETQVFIHITARRISLVEYSVTVSKLPPKAIREGIDTTSSIPLLTLQDLGEQGTPMRLSLMDNQQLNVMPKGILEALGHDETVVLRAHPMNSEMRSCVELVPPHHTEFCSRCDICEVDLPTKEISDAHFASEDHETAQVLHPLAEAVQDTIHDNLLATTTVSHHRREEVTCKLCGRKFLDTEPLVAHIRLEHERDHPHSLAPRPIARTAPPLEATRESF